MKNKDTLHVSRRRFLAQLGGLTVAGMLGPSLLTPRSAAIIVLCASPGMKRWICSIRNWSGCKPPTGRARY